MPLTGGVCVAAEPVRSAFSRRDDAGLDVAALEPAPTVTSGVIFSMVLAGTPARARSLTELYGLPAIIFLAVAGPTPGNLSSSASLALFRSTRALSDCDADA